MLGSKIIERHYTLDRSMRGTDHSGSLELKGIEYILKYIKQIKTALGSSKKILHQSEKIALNKLRGDLLKK
jgi:sialic acid synthase SpsE